MNWGAAGRARVHDRGRPCCYWGLAARGRIEPCLCLPWPPGIRRPGPGRPDDADLCGHNAAVLSVQLRPIRLVNYATWLSSFPFCNNTKRSWRLYPSSFFCLAIDFPCYPNPLSAAPGSANPANTPIVQKPPGSILPTKIRANGQREWSGLLLGRSTGRPSPHIHNTQEKFRRMRAI